MNVGISKNWGPKVHVILKKAAKFLLHEDVLNVT